MRRVALVHDGCVGANLVVVLEKHAVFVTVAVYKEEKGKLWLTRKDGVVPWPCERKR